MEHLCEPEIIVGRLEIDGKTVIGPIEHCPECDRREPLQDLSCRDHTWHEHPGWATFYAWCRGMQKTHAQVQCPECQLWKIWLPKETS